MTFLELSRNCLGFFTLGFLGSAVLSFLACLFFITRKFSEVIV